MKPRHPSKTALPSSANVPPTAPLPREELSPQRRRLETWPEDALLESTPQPTTPQETSMVEVVAITESKNDIESKHDNAKTNAPNADRSVVIAPSAISPWAVGALLVGVNAMLKGPEPATTASAPVTPIPTPPLSPSPNPTPADTVPPLFQNAVTNSAGDRIVLTYNETLSVTTAVPSAFTVTINGVAHAVTAVAVHGNAVELNLGYTVAHGQSVTLTYLAPSANAATTNAAVQDTAGNDAASLGNVTVLNIVPDTAAFASSAEAFAAWQEAETAWVEQTTLGTTTHRIDALQQHSAAMMQVHDTTGRDGSANQSDAALRQSQWIDAINGTDIVSHANYEAGVVITGKAAAGFQATLQWRLDKDRTDGIEGQGAQVLHLGNNDVDGDGVNDVTASYDNVTGEWRMNFTPSSHALQAATHNTWGSGVHQLVVDANGNGTQDATEPQRLFLVADGTAQVTDTGLANQNHSVQDRITGDVFVYFYGDPDGASGTSFWTPLDAQDTASNTAINPQDKDGDGSDWDYYASAADLQNLAAVTASNTALHWVTQIDAQVWAFHMANVGAGTWDVANAQATDHAARGSNTSRLPSLAECLALYAANFGGDNRAQDKHLVGALQPMSNAIQNDPNAVENWTGDNRPAGWDEYVNEWGGYFWAATPTPRGHAQVWLGYGQLGESANPTYVAAVL